jgi:quercetin dioxygenase-like cupin family protein
VATTPPDFRYESGTTVRYLATGASTHGLFGLYRWDMAAGPGGPDPHFHRTISESFYVLDGTIAIFDGRAWIDTRPGDFVHVPEGGIHGFKNRSGAPASHDDRGGACGLHAAARPVRQRTSLTIESAIASGDRSSTSIVYRASAW